MARKTIFQFSYEGSNYLARHLRGSCLKESSCGENTGKLGVRLEEISHRTIELRRIYILTNKLLDNVSAEVHLQLPFSGCLHGVSKTCTCIASSTKTKGFPQIPL